MARRQRDTQETNKDNRRMGLAGQGSRADQRGYAMVALLVGLSVMSVLMSVALPVWSHATRREREDELIWRGEQYKRAIMLFQRKFANTFPPTIDVLVEQKFLRKKYKDPITGEDFQIIPVGAGTGQMPGMGGGPPGSTGGSGPAGGSGFGGGAMGSSGFGGQQSPGGFGSVGGGTPGTQAAMGIQGVTSKSKETSIKLYNNMNKYNQWAFVHLAASMQAGAGGAQFGKPGQTGPTGPSGAPPGFGPPGMPPPGFGPGGGFGQPNMTAPMPGSVPTNGGFGQPGAPGAQPKFPALPGGGFGTPVTQPGGAGGATPFKPPPA